MHAVLQANRLVGTKRRCLFYKPFLAIAAPQTPPIPQTRAFPRAAGDAPLCRSTKRLRCLAPACTGSSSCPSKKPPCHGASNSARSERCLGAVFSISGQRDAPSPPGRCSEMKAYGGKMSRGNIAALRRGCWKVLSAGAERLSPLPGPCCGMLLLECQPQLWKGAGERKSSGFNAGVAVSVLRQGHPQEDEAPSGWS